MCFEYVLKWDDKTLARMQAAIPSDDYFVVRIDRRNYVFAAQYSVAREIIHILSQNSISPHFIAAADMRTMLNALYTRKFQKFQGSEKLYDEFMSETEARQDVGIIWLHNIAAAQ